MNLLQILTNENKILINILTILLSIPEAYLFSKFFSAILSINTTKRKTTIFILLMTTCTGISLFIKNSLIKDTSILLVFLLLMIYLYKQTIKNAFLSILISYTSVLTCEYITTSMLIQFIHITHEDIMLKPIYYTAGLGLTLILMTIIYFLLKLFKAKELKIKQFFKISISTSIIVNLLLGTLTMIIETYLFSVYVDVISLRLLIVMVLTTLIYFSTSMYSLIRTNILEKTEADLENEKLYNKTLTHLHDNIRGFKHDFDNIVQSIGGYITLNDMEGLTEYYKRLLEDCKMTNNLNLLNPETINNPSIYSLLTNKYYLATEKGINMTFSVFTDLSHINFNMYEFSRILGILLDNAIEAAEESDQKTVNIEFTSDNKKQLFIISNSCKDTNISTTQIFEKGYSTKNRNSGFGLWHVHKVLEKNTNLDLFTTIKDNVFSQQLAVYY